MNRVIYKMGRSCKITANGNAAFNQKGKVPMIDIRIANKTGSKKVSSGVMKCFRLSVLFERNYKINFTGNFD